MKAPAGRQRFNVPGASNALTPELVTVTNDAYINAASVCELPGKIAAPPLEIPITLVLDNAKYQRCKAVLACAESLGIELLFLPPYSPNLNLIERLWLSSRKSACIPDTTINSPRLRPPSPAAPINWEQSTRKNWPG